ncbi:ABC transporter substrate-binding protein [Desulforudis sp. 1088]|uniref:ABC transporter substrate-binding protein n=1 Tax=unclassified Candidatus Desulforudis TaxID=2635950 RepID=UPI003CE4BC5D
MLRKKPPVLLILVGLLAVVLLVSGCTREKEKPLRLGMLPITDNLPFWVAEAKGYFGDAGVEVELVHFPSALERDTAIQAGQIDGALGDIIAVAQLNAGGSPVKIVSIGQGVTAEEGRFAILASPKSDITEPSQLKGVPVACSLKTIMEYVVDELLVSAGLGPEEIKKVQIAKIPQRLDALLNGTVQAAVLPDPIAALAEVKGARVIVEDTAGANITQTVIYFRQETLDHNGRAVKKLMQAYARAVEDIQASPRAYDTLLAEKARVPAPVLENSNHGMKVLFSPPQVPTEEQISRVVEWMTAHGILAKPMRYDDLVDKRVLAE